MHDPNIELNYLRKILQRRDCYIKDLQKKIKELLDEIDRIEFIAEDARFELEKQKAKYRMLEEEYINIKTYVDSLKKKVDDDIMSTNK